LYSINLTKVVKTISWIFITNPKSCLVHTGLHRMKAHSRFRLLCCRRQQQWRHPLPQSIQHEYICTFVHTFVKFIAYNLINFFKDLCSIIFCHLGNGCRHCCCRLQHKSLNRLCAFIRCNPVWTRQDFGLVINIHEIVLTNDSKGQS
jgi:hypothetical protein